MNRLLQGDVGCGKTAVAAYAAIHMAFCGGQTVILCPTEILARQHYETVRGYFNRAGVTCTLAIRGHQEKHHTAHIIIGTTALLVHTFDKLGLVIVDEQHKFGVEQRAAIRDHGHPHVLVMTATPIPRTIAMTVFGDLDTSVIKEMPPGRQLTQTYWVQNLQEPTKAPLFHSASAVIQKELLAKRQVYVVCPRIDAIDDEMQAVSDTWQYYRSQYPHASVSFLHGQMSAKDKQMVMDWWAAPSPYGRILVATTVVEVGVDCPDATVMVIENAERFGLAQLHQLRGRIGRSDKQGYCFLISDTESGDGRRRLKAMVETNDGFEVAERDLSIRGPGDLLSTKQHGLPDLKLADLVEDYDLLLAARDRARELVRKDPDLHAHPEHLTELTRRFGNGLNLGDIG